MTVQAAGGVVWRAAGAAIEVLLVHRPRYDDWTLPKGKLDDGESHAQAAVREVREETGFAVALGEEVARSGYTDARGRPKEVRYWAMTVVEGAFAPNDEVDEVAWLAPDDASERLTYPRDREVLAVFVTAHVGG